MTDSLLVSKAKTGDSSAWADLIKKYSAFVEAKSKNYSTNNNIDEKDLYQEGMIGLISAVHSFDENREAEFKTYAETVICNQMLSALRNANSKKNLPLSTYVSIEEDDEFVSPTPSPEEAFLLNEELELVNGFIENSLSKKPISFPSFFWFRIISQRREGKRRKLCAEPTPSQRRLFPISPNPRHWMR